MGLFVRLVTRDYSPCDFLDGTQVIHNQFLYPSLYIYTYIYIYAYIHICIICVLCISLYTYTQIYSYSIHYIHICAHVNSYNKFVCLSRYFCFVRIPTSHSHIPQALPAGPQCGGPRLSARPQEVAGKRGL